MTYTLDALDRMLTRLGTGVGTGADNSATSYGYTGGGDSADLQLGASNVIGERYLSLPGGVLLTRRYTTSGGDVRSIPNIHGDITATTGATGTLTGSGFVYDPFGQPINPTTGVTAPTSAPSTRSNGPTDAWEGQHQVGYENTDGLNATVMGARLYLPTWGQFTSLDPIQGGNPNPYVYPVDPVNGSDLTGDCWGCGWLKKHWRGVLQTTAFVGCLAASAGACAVAGLAVAAATNLSRSKGGRWSFNTRGFAIDAAGALIGGAAGRGIAGRWGGSVIDHFGAHVTASVGRRGAIDVGQSMLNFAVNQHIGAAGLAATAWAHNRWS